MNFIKFLRNNTILLICVSVFLCFSLAILFFTDAFYFLLQQISVWVRQWFGRYYLYLGLGCVLFLLILALLPTGKIVLGKKNEQPEFTRFSWVAMLYSAGMGAGVLLRAVQEPVFMYANPPLNTGSSAELLALEFTFYQWGFTAWAFYALFALILGIAVMKWNQLPLLSSTLKRQVPFPALWDTLDILVILTTVIGVTGAICLGTTQITEGINFLKGGTPFGLDLNTLFLLIICFLAFISAWQGLNKGIKVVSNLNIGLTVILLLYVITQGDLIAILKAFTASLWLYIKDFVPMSLALGNYDPGEQFLRDWTYYYWAFWIAWAPFTGIFIARISRGRTLREFVIGVLVIPSLASFLWFSSFGETAIQFIKTSGGYSGQFSNEFSSIFEFLSLFPGAAIMNPLVIILLIGFLVTSADSAIYVLSMFTDKGNLSPQKKHRLIWAALLAIGGFALLVLSDIRSGIDIINILQLLLIVTSLPFALLIPVITYFFLKRLLRK